VAHRDSTVKRVFETVFSSMVALFEQSLGGAKGEQIAIEP
jgi:hypothetical protein